MTPEQQVERAVNHALSEKLKAARAELLAEDRSVVTMLAECKHEGYRPAKDYWHKQKKLRDKVAMLENTFDTDEGGMTEIEKLRAALAEIKNVPYQRCKNGNFKKPTLSMIGKMCMIARAALNSTGEDYGQKTSEDNGGADQKGTDKSAAK